MKKLRRRQEEEGSFNFEFTFSLAKEEEEERERGCGVAVVGYVQAQSGPLSSLSLSLSLSPMMSLPTWRMRRQDEQQDGMGHSSQADTAIGAEGGREEAEQKRAQPQRRDGPARCARSS